MAPGGQIDAVPRSWRLIAAAPEFVACAMTGFALPAMVLLLSGHLSWPLAFPLGALGAAIAVAFCGPSREQVDRHVVLASVAAAVLVLVWLVVNSFYSAQDLFAHRDATTYNIAGRWLIDNQRMPIATHPGLFGSPAGYVDESAGFRNSSLGHVYAQGNHLLPVLLAAVGKIFGTGGLLRANIVFGALALFVFFGLARRVVGPMWALAAMSALAVSMPMIFVARDAYSEPLAVLYLMGGLLLLHRGVTYGRVADYALAGLVAGTTAMVRIDAYVALLAFIVVAAVLLARAGPGARAAVGVRVAAMLGTVVVGGALGWADVAWLSSGYYHDERTHILLQIEAALGLAVVAAVAVLISWRPSVLAWLGSDRIRARAAAIISVAIVVAFAVLASRPLWFVGHGRQTPYLETVQRHAGDAVDGTRTYAEQSLSWQALYFGWPTIVLAAIGYVLLTWQLLRRRDYALLGLLTMGLATSALYLWAPEITPDQVYAARRYVPVIMPAFLVAAAAALRQIWPRFGWFGRVLGAAGAAAMIAIPLVVMIPTFTLREEVPQLAQVDAICTRVGPSGAVVLLDDTSQYSYQQTIRSYCEVPALGLPGGQPAQLAPIRAALQANGLTLFVLATTTAGNAFTAGVAAPAPFSSVTTTRWPSTLHTTPSGSTPESVTVYLGTVGVDGRVQALVP